MDDDIPSPFKERYEYKEHSSCHSFQLNDVLMIQNVFAIVCKSRQRGIYMENLEIWNPESGTGTGTGTAIGVNWETLKAVQRRNLSRYSILIYSQHLRYYQGKLGNWFEKLGSWFEKSK